MFNEIQNLKIPTEFENKTYEDMRFEALSEREYEVFELWALLNHVPDITNKLYLSTGTVKTHMNNIRGKLQIDCKPSYSAQGNFVWIYILFGQKIKENVKDCRRIALEPEEIIGKKYGQLTVLSISMDKKLWRAECHCGYCGNIKAIPLYNVIRQKTRSCGCLIGKREREVQNV